MPFKNQIKLRRPTCARLHSVADHHHAVLVVGIVVVVVVEPSAYRRHFEGCIQRDCRDQLLQLANDAVATETAQVEPVEAPIS